ncbi:MAG: DUF302 domain-containing protein [Candidatus Fermentibacterota bacterium]
MSKSLVSIVITVSLVASAALAENGLVTVQSNFSVRETGNRLERQLEEKGMTVFARIDHAAGADSAGLALRPTELFIFGNPNVGTPLMQCSQSMAIDLPQKMLIWQDESGAVWLSYNDPHYLAERHELQSCDESIAIVAEALAGFARAAAAD